MIVADTNTIAYLYLRSPFTDDVENCLREDPVWIAPYLWRSEMRNIISIYIRKSLLNFNQALVIMNQAEQLLVGNEYAVDSVGVLETATQTGCSAYDSEFIYLARQTQSQLITADKEILRKCTDVAITAKAFIS